MDDHNVVPSKQDEGQPIDSRPKRRDDYEAPKMVIIGPLEKITLGSGGDMNDALNKLKRDKSG